MRTLSWRSCTSGATNLGSILSSLKECPHDATPFSDVRIVLLAASVYLLTLVLLYHLPRPSFAHGKSFTRLATFHNLLLCLGSLTMFIGVLNATFAVASNSGISATICTLDDSPLPGVIQFWLYVFYLSKYYELLDTPILLLRGRPLTVLHVWHHASVVFETWSWLEYRVTVGAYGMMFNTFIHVIMYAYFAAALLKIPFPLKRYITVTQIIQFLTSFVSLIPWGILHYRRGCSGAVGLLISGLINGSFLILFIRFYKGAYKKQRKTGGEKKE